MPRHSRSRNLHESHRKIASPVTDASRHPLCGQTSDINDFLAGLKDKIAKSRVSIEVIDSDGLKDRRFRITVQ